jgi:hypothetical protein
MANHTWNHERSTERIKRTLSDVESVEIVQYVRDMDLNGIPKNKAYKVDGVHLYVDLLNLDDILENNTSEGELSHKRTIRFLDLHIRAIHRILSACDAIKVDFHNQRLHAVVAKPYNASRPDAESHRVRRAVAIAQLIIDVLNETGDADDAIDPAKVRVGIDTGITLAVNNGRHHDREPLFLGEPANHAAKHAAGTSTSARGIFLTNTARQAMGLDTAADSKKTALTHTVTPPV